MKVVTIQMLEQNIIFTLAILLFFCAHKSWCSSLQYFTDSVGERNTNASTPEIAPIPVPQGPQPLLPLLAPSPLVPFTNNSVPKLSGHCSLNFTAGEQLMTTTSINCYAYFAPLLANVVCCPQLEATLTILIGQYSKVSNLLALNGTSAEHCLSDTEQILMGQGASNGLRQLCSVKTSDLTEGFCPVKSVDEFERSVDVSKLLAACQKIDPVKECCMQVCQNAIMEAATEISQKSQGLLDTDEQKPLSKHSTRTNHCKRIVHRWLASKLDASRAKEVLRGLSNCNTNKVCPLVLPGTRHVTKHCSNATSNRTACCGAMNNYLSHLQKQSLVTNLQALDCSTKLGTRLQKSNITNNIYGMCQISLKDFSLQVGTQEAGCLLPSLPTDATLDKSSGVSFTCDLNDNIPAPWPSTYQSSASSCNKTVKIPALPAATSGQTGHHSGIWMVYMFLASLFMIV